MYLEIKYWEGLQFLLLHSYSNEKIYNYLIEECNSVIKNVPSKYIAEFIVISAEWLSKTKKKI